MGTAATMQIEENLALAARRGKPRTLRIGITKAEREQYRELLKSLDLGLEDRLTAKRGPAVRRPASGADPADGDHEQAQAPAAGRAHRRPRPQDGRQGAGRHSAEIVEENHLTTMMITHNMKDAIKYGNRLIMMHEGHIIYDVSGEEKKKLHGLRPAGKVPDRQRRRVCKRPDDPVLISCTPSSSARGSFLIL